MYTGQEVHCNQTSSVMDVILTDGGFLRFYYNSPFSGEMTLTMYPPGSCFPSSGASPESFYTVPTCYVSNSICGVATSSCVLEPTYQCVPTSTSTNCASYSYTQCSVIPGCALSEGFCSGPGSCLTLPDSSFCDMDSSCIWRVNTCLPDCYTKDLANCGGNCAWSQADLCVASDCSNISCGGLENQGCQKDYNGVCMPASYRYDPTVNCPFRVESYCSDYYYCDPSLAIHNATDCQNVIDSYCCSSGFQNFDPACLTLTTPTLTCPSQCEWEMGVLKMTIPWIHLVSFLFIYCLSSL